MSNLFNVPELVDYLHGDQRSLRHTARVAKLWQTSSQFHLFESVWVNNDAKLGLLSSCLKHNLAMGSYIRSLRTTDFDSPDWDMFYAFVNLTLAMPALASLELEGMTWPDLSYWHPTVVTGASSLRNLEISRSDFRGYTSATKVLETFPSVRRLIVNVATNYLDPYQGMNMRKLADRGVLSIEELVLRANPDSSMAPALARVFAEQSPRILNFDYYRTEDLSIVKALCVKIGSRIQELHVALRLDFESGESFKGRRSVILV